MRWLMSGWRCSCIDALNSSEPKRTPADSTWGLVGIWDGAAGGSCHGDVVVIGVGGDWIIVVAE
jgi:hypothetical protein